MDDFQTRLDATLQKVVDAHYSSEQQDAARIQLTKGALDGLVISPTADAQGEVASLLFTVDTLPGVRLMVDIAAAREIRDALSVLLGAPAQTIDTLVSAQAKLRAGLTDYINDAIKACGDERVSGEPLAQVIARMRGELQRLRDEASPGDE